MSVTLTMLFSSRSVNGVGAFELKIWSYITELHLQTGGALNKKSDWGNKALIREMKIKKSKTSSNSLNKKQEEWSTKYLMSGHNSNQQIEQNVCLKLTQLWLEEEMNSFFYALCFKCRQEKNKTIILPLHINTFYDWQ